MSLIVDTAVSGTTYSFDMLFSYAVPESMYYTLWTGCRVIVPFGRGNQKRTAVVMKIRDGDSSNLKYVEMQADEKPVISDELIELSFYLHDNTFCTYYDAVRTMLPAGYNIVISGNSAHNAVRKNLIKNVKFSQEYLENPEKFSLTPKQSAVADTLENSQSMPEKELAYICGVTSSVIKRMIESNVLESFENEVYREVYSSECEKRNIDDIVLSDEQKKAFDEISAGMKNNVPSCFLLHGVTGSGKTLIFEKLINEAVSSGKTAMLLIPEIALTPQILQRFRSLFGKRIAVLHSGLSAGQRYDEHRRIKNGDADIVIGTRSAVFAPLENIGIIIMDEEGERSYKSDCSPRYSTADVARQRCRYHKCILLLASATPSVESYYRAERNIYKLVELKQRYNNAPLPEVHIVDMNNERTNGNRTGFSHVLSSEIQKNLENGEQTVILLNRRGYHTVMSCIECGQPVYCQNCSAPMTYHKPNGKLMCHYCGYVADIPETCGKCGSHRFKMTGTGTQRVEEELEMFFPDARVLRMDADTTFSRLSYEKNFKDFADGKYDIMLGTQMIGKGLDFPNVTLVGVISVDNSLYSGDFRGYERTFSLITQVVGRGGRDGRHSRAYLQTFMPDHYIINLASKQDYAGFYNEEIQLRRSLIYPPVCDLCIIGISSPDEEKVISAGKCIISIIGEALKNWKYKTPVRVNGPLQCSKLRINGKFRHRIIIKCKNTDEIRNFISSVIKKSAKCKELNGVSIYADMNGDIGI